MSRARRSIECPRDPIGLSSMEASAYLGISESTFKAAVEKGFFPGAHELFGRLLWDAEELRAAFRRLPRRGKAGQDEADIDWSDVAA